MKRVIYILLVALCLGGIFHQDMILQHFMAPDDKVAAPMQSSRTRFGDNYYYYITSKKAIIKLNPLANDKLEQSFFYSNSGLENIYPGALLIAGFLDSIAKLIPINWNMQIVLSLILQVGFLLTSALVAYTVLRGSNTIPWIELFIFGFIWAYFSRGVIYGVYTGILTYPFTTSAFYYPDFLRLVNPQITWAFSLFYLAVLTMFFKDPSRKLFLGIVSLSLLLGLFSIVLTATVILGLGLYGLANLIKDRKIDFHLVGIGVALLGSLLYARYQIHLFQQTAKGEVLQTGDFAGLSIKINYFYMLIFLPLIRKFIPPSAKSPLSWLYFSALILGSVGDSFHLGSRIWLRGSAVFVHFLLIYGIIEFLRTIFAAPWEKVSKHIITPWLISVLIFISVFLSLKPNYTGWYGYIEKDKAQVIEWLQINSDRNDVIVSPNLEDAYLIPLYTHSQPYVHLFDYSSLTYQQLIHRYFQTLDLFGVKQQYLARILEYENLQRINMFRQISARPEQRVDYDKYQIYSFYSEVMYYPYNKAVENIFSTPELNQEFDQKISKLASQSKAEDIEKMDFIIYEKRLEMRKPKGYTVRFENNQYEILSKIIPEHQAWLMTETIEHP